jgi:catechol 2,3-dioxygenase-like lactoylglutathione lyase family enzyme
MPITGFDHVAITVSDVEATLSWYERVLGAEVLYLDLWREGKIPVGLLQVGSCRLSVHDVAKPSVPHAEQPVPGAGDLCFRFDGPVSEILSLLDAAEVPVVEGPVPRPASNGEFGSSVYFRDPDGNIVELLTLDDDTVA